MAELKLLYVHGSLGVTKHSDNMPPFLIGGHIVLRINEHYYGFEPKEPKLTSIHIFPQKKYFSRVSKETHNEFQERWKNSRITEFAFTVTEEKYSALQGELEECVTETPYDYAVFGKRCFSFVYDILQKANIIKNIPVLGNSFLVSIPRLQLWFLKKFLVENFSLRTEQIQSGSSNRVWI